jgi:hypothetical protein
MGLHINLAPHKVADRQSNRLSVVRYLGTSYADFVIGDLMTEAIDPVLLHQDPRHFRRGTGSAWSRLAGAAGQIFWTHRDSDHTQFNFSEIIGNSTARGDFDRLLSGHPFVSASRIPVIGEGRWHRGIRRRRPLRNQWRHVVVQMHAEEISTLCPRERSHCVDRSDQLVGVELLYRGSWVWFRQACVRPAESCAFGMLE